jgi:hypothetical protein
MYAWWGYHESWYQIYAEVKIVKKSIDHK